MTKNKDIRWIQRLNSYSKALEGLSGAIDLSSKRNLSNLEEQGLIKSFELAYELAWLTIKDFYEYVGVTNIQGSRDAFRLAFKEGIIEKGDVFMQSIESRRLSVHTYNENTVKKIHADIVDKYYQAFVELKHTLEKEQRQRIENGELKIEN